MQRAAAVLLAGLMSIAITPAVLAQGAQDAVCATNQVPDPTSTEERFFCEPMDSTFFIQFDQFVEGLELLDAQYPDFVELREIGQSVGGLPVYFVEVTNEQSPVPREEKLQIGYSASIHANEPAGREGMIRIIEDLAAGVGPNGAELQPYLDHVLLNVWFPNPDSWASGDYFDADAVAGVHDPQEGTGFQRGNLNAFDLNRQFPNPGWIEPDHQSVSQPEAQAVVEELRYSGRHQSLVAGADLHGMLGSPNMIRSIIPNQDYDLRRMVLIVDQLRTIQERVEANPSYAEWNELDNMEDLLENGLPTDVELRDPVVGIVEADFERPFEWGARWDMIGYTDTGFTSDYLTLSPRSPTGGMGAVGTIVEFTYSHLIPDNKFIPKLVDMHVAGVREIVRTQIEMAGRLETPMLTFDGAAGYAWTDDLVTSAQDPNAYEGSPFDLMDPAAKFDFKQVDYEVSNLNFWRDLDRFSTQEWMRVDAAAVTADQLSGLAHFALTDQAVDALSDDGVAALLQWTESGGNLILTDGALRFLERAGLASDRDVMQQCVYVGHSVLQDLDHPLLAGVDWDARVTGEASAVGFKANRGQDWNYPEWGLTLDAMDRLGADAVGTTVGHTGDGTWKTDTCTTETGDTLATLGRIPVGEGRIDFIGGALPQPTQAFDHRYGLADYSVSALTYWVVINSLGGQIVWEPLASPFVPSYDFDPLYADSAAGGEPAGTQTPGPSLLAMLVVVGAVIVVLRRRGA